MFQVIEIPDNLIPANALKVDHLEDERQTRTAGDTWFDQAGALAVRVSSVIIPQESNFLINPVHPDSQYLNTAALEPFAIDARLLG